jgi:hypothetical protein
MDLRLGATAPTRGNNNLKPIQTLSILRLVALKTQIFWVMQISSAKRTMSLKKKMTIGQTMIFKVATHYTSKFPETTVRSSRPAQAVNPMAQITKSLVQTSLKRWRKPRRNRTSS